MQQPEHCNARSALPASLQRRPPPAAHLVLATHTAAVALPPAVAAQPMQLQLPATLRVSAAMAMKQHQAPALCLATSLAKPAPAAPTQRMASQNAPRVLRTPLHSAITLDVFVMRAVQARGLAPALTAQ